MPTSATPGVEQGGAVGKYTVPGRCPLCKSAAGHDLKADEAWCSNIACWLGRRAVMPVHVWNKIAITKRPSRAKARGKG